MNRNARCLVGLLLLCGVAPVIVILWPEAAAPERARGCMDGLGFGLDLTMDFTSLFVAAGAALAGMAFVVSSFFGRDGADEAIES